MSGAVAAITPFLWKTNPVTSSSLSAKTRRRSIIPSPLVSERIEIVSSGSRACRGSAFDVPQRVALLVGLEQLVDVRTLTGPGDAAQEQRPVVDAVEVLVEM